MKDTPQQILPSPAYWSELFCAGTDHSDLDGDRQDWNEKSVNFVQKGRKDDYINHLIARLALEPGDEVFDMGCGAGTLAVPLAKRGHRIIAADFSDGMLEGLRSYAREEGVEDRIEAHSRAWQDDLSDLPVADVAISSRSLIVGDLAAAIAKLESKARKRCIVTLPLTSPHRYETELGLVQTAAHDGGYRAKTTVILGSYLFSIGRLPRIDYLAHPRQSHGETAEALIARTLKYAKDSYPEDEERVRAWLESHIVPDEEKGGVRYDYQEFSYWTYLEWDVPKHEA